jgi:hypothetical protein
LPGNPLRLGPFRLADRPGSQAFPQIDLDVPKAYRNQGVVPIIGAALDMTGNLTRMSKLIS